MTLVRIRHAAQLTLPLEVRKALKVKDGDYLDAQITRDGVTLRPVTVIERERAWARIEKATSRVRETGGARKSGIAEEKTIAREVKAQRRKHG